MHARVLRRLITTAAAAGDLVLAARCVGALGSTAPPRTPGGPGSVGAPDPELTHALSAPAYATFVAEGRAGGIQLITALYPG
jgi:hypothetical protein